jgi:hypothetical protein
LTTLSRSLAALDPDSTLIAVIELSRSSWLVDGLSRATPTPTAASDRFPWLYAGLNPSYKALIRRS